jgi:hypothetical protein
VFLLLALLALLVLGLTSGTIFLLAKLFVPRAAPRKIAAFIAAVATAFVISVAIVSVTLLAMRVSKSDYSPFYLLAYCWCGSVLLSFVTVRYMRPRVIEPLALVCASIVGALGLPALVFQVFAMLFCLSFEAATLKSCLAPFWQD